MTPVVTKTLAALGHARQPDAFQSGREAAQMAKGQLSSASPSNLVLVFGSDNVHFKDLIEGVRLVTGEDVLVGIPTRRVIANEVYSANASVVLMLQSNEIHATMASTPFSAENHLSATTSLFSQFRTSRGNARKQFNEHGLLIFDNTNKNTSSMKGKMFAAEAGLDSWIIHTQQSMDHRTPMICGDKSISDGLLAVEFLSQKKWGVGEVGIGEFKNLNGIYQHAIRSALRAALSEMDENKPLFGLVLFNFPIDDISAMELKNFFVAAASVVGGIPLIGISTSNQYIRDADQSVSLDGDWLTVLLAPQ